MRNAHRSKAAAAIAAANASTSNKLARARRARRDRLDWSPDNAINHLPPLTGDEAFCDEYLPDGFGFGRY